MVTSLKMELRWSSEGIIGYISVSLKLQPDLGFLLRYYSSGHKETSMHLIQQQENGCIMRKKEGIIVYVNSTDSYAYCVALEFYYHLCTLNFNESTYINSYNMYPNKLKSKYIIDLYSSHTCI